MNKQILARDFDKKDFFIGRVLAMNGIDCMKYFSEYLQVTGY